MDYKVEFVESVQAAQDDADLTTITTPTSYFRPIGCSNHDIATNVARFGKWSKKEELEKLMKRKLGNLKRVRTGKSSFEKLESNLLAKIKHHRKNSRRVSNSFIRITALKIFEELKSDESSGYQGKAFKASVCWQCRFIKRNVKICQEKKLKKKHPNDHIEKFEKFLSTLRFKLLSAPSNDTTIYELWGRFRPEHRFNMDQVPLPFVVNQDYTYTEKDDKTIHVKSPAEALRKRQFTMHIVKNAGRGNNKCGYIDLVAKGKGLRITNAEKEAWDNHVQFFWQKNAWVDSIVMQELAKRFVSG